MPLQTPNRINWTTQQGANLLPTRRKTGANEFNQNIKALGALGRVTANILGGEGIYYGGTAVLGIAFENAGTLGNGINARSFTYYIGRLYCAANNSHVYRLSGRNTWEDLGAVASLGGIWDIVTYSGSLHVCGNNGYVYKLVNNVWTSIGQPYAGVVNSLKEFNGKLYAAAANGHVYEWSSGTSWTDRGLVGSASNIYDLEVFNNKLYSSTDTGYVYEWVSGTTWTSRGQPSGGSASVRVLTVYSSNLFAGSDTTVYKWGGGISWTSYGDPISGQNVTALVSYKNNIYAGSANGHVARWSSGTTWLDLDAVGATSSVNAFFEYFNRLYIGGDATLTQIFRIIDINDDFYFDGQNYPLVSMLIEDDTDDKTTWAFTTNAKTAITFEVTGPVAGALYAVIDTISTANISDFAKSGNANLTFIARAAASAAPENSIRLGIGNIATSTFTTWTPDDIIKQTLSYFDWLLTSDDLTETKISIGQEISIIGSEAINTTLESQNGYSRQKLVTDIVLADNSGLEFVDGQLRVRTKDNYIIYIDSQGRLVADLAWFVIGNTGTKQLAENEESLTITGDIGYPDVWTYIKTNSGTTKEIGIKLQDQLYAINQWGETSYTNSDDVPIQTFQNNVYFEGKVKLQDIAGNNYAILDGVDTNDIVFYLRDPGTDRQIGITGPIGRFTINATSQQATAVATAINWQTSSYMDGIYWSPNTNPSRIFVQPGGAGMYLIATKVGFAAAAAGYREVQISLTSGATVIQKYAREVSSSSTRPTFVKCYDIFEMKDDDYIEINVLQNSGGNLNLISSAYVSSTYNKEYTTDVAIIRLSAWTS